jgi:hypothetical protein
MITWPLGILFELSVGRFWQARIDRSRILPYGPALMLWDSPSAGESSRRSVPTDFLEANVTGNSRFFLFNLERMRYRFGRE